jgi:hypothetical protein
MRTGFSHDVVRQASTMSRDMTWQGREDSNLRPSVLETDALTRLSYAPKADAKVSIVRWLEGSAEEWLRNRCLS